MGSAIFFANGFSTGRVGIIGVELMGHRIALNVLKGSFWLVMMDHPSNQPINDLIEMDDRRRGSPRAVAAEADLIVLCVTGSVQVDAGVISALETRNHRGGLLDRTAGL